MPMNQFLKPDIGNVEVAKWAAESVGEIERLRYLGQTIRETLDARKRENIQRLIHQEIPDYFKTLRGRLCQRCTERQG